MDEQPEPAPLDWRDHLDDPEIAALLDFDPVLRRAKRHDGWSPDHQRGYIVGLAIYGNVDRAAQLVDRTQSGAWTVRNSAGAEGFAEAWDAALAFHRRRNPRRAPLPPRHEPPARHARELRMARGAAMRDEPDEAETARVFREILAGYARKLAAERKARLAGRIVEADFYVRQLTFIELVLEAGGQAREVIAPLKLGRLPLLEVVATPCSNLLERLRRAIWLEKGEADRPPPPPLGVHDPFAAIGESGARIWRGPQDGDPADWQRREAEKAALRAEAQAAWEERAREDAEAWAAREAAPVPRRRPGPSGAAANDDNPDDP